MVHSLFHLLPFKLHCWWTLVRVAVDLAFALPAMACGLKLPKMQGCLDTALAPLRWLPGGRREGAREWALASAALLSAEMLSGGSWRARYLRCCA
jgi:hypothetical protein